MEADSIVSFLLWLSLSPVTALYDQPYCTARFKRLCQGKGEHVACQFPHPDPSPSCQNYTAIEFANYLKNFILHYINRRRQRIAAGNERVKGGARLPKPEMMMLVEWDRELASLAQRLANQCRFMHDDCRATVRYPYAGQTVGEVRWRRAGEHADLGAQRAISRVLDAWWGERRRATPNQLTAPFRVTSRGAVWGHFSQLAVWTLQAIGCGAVHHGVTHPRLLLVCDFSHTNMLGQRTISPGPAAPCPAHTARRLKSLYPLLCAPIRYSPSQEQYDDDDEEELDLNSEPEYAEKEDSLFIKKYKEPSTTLKLMHREDKQILYKPKPVIEAKLDEELDSRRRDKAAYKARISLDNFMREWTRQQSYLGKLHEKQDNFREVIPLKVHQKQTEQLDNQDLDDDYRSNAGQITKAPFLRQRWKQSRNRPKRPGANALLYTQPMKYTQQSRLLVVSLKMDKEDADQLFQDTGFKAT